MSQVKNNLVPYIVNNSFNNLKNCTFYLRKENFKPTLEWAKNKIDISLKSIGNRYITYNNKEFTDLNIKLTISNYFNSVTSVEEFSFSDFYYSLNNDDYESAMNYAETGYGVRLTLERNKESKEFYLKDKYSILCSKRTKTSF